jgi:hypothetical protein
VRPEAVLDRVAFDEAYVLLHKVDFPDLVKRTDRIAVALGQPVQAGHDELALHGPQLPGQGDQGAPRQALLNGRVQVIPTDLDVLGHITTFRISEELNRNVPQMLAEVIQCVCEQKAAAALGAALTPAPTSRSRAV